MFSEAGQHEKRNLEMLSEDNKYFQPASYRTELAAETTDANTHTHALTCVEKVQFLKIVGERKNPPESLAS